MFEYRSNTTFSDVAQQIRQAKSIALVAHTKPDGDALGSQLALYRALKKTEIEVEIFVMGPVEPALLKITHSTPLRNVDAFPPGDDYDLIIVLDTGAWSQLEPLADWLKAHHDRIIVIDHHQRGDDVAGLRIIESNVSATAVLVARLLDALGYSIDGGVGGMAEALFVGLATDTGWFRYSNTDAETFALAARLLDAGVDNARLYQILEENFTPSRIALEARALMSLEYFNHGSIAIQQLTLHDFEETGGKTEELTGLVNNPLAIGMVQVSIFMSEIEPGQTKISFRSKPSLDDDPPIDVNELAQRFGGGGHIHAAGARMKLPLSEAKETLLAELSDVCEASQS